MKAKDIKTIDVITKTWFDKVNGNTYFAQVITINCGRKNAKTFINPFQYGYSSYDHEAVKKVAEVTNIKTDIFKLWFSGSFLLRNHVERGCKKRDLTHIGDFI